MRTRTRSTGPSVRCGSSTTSTNVSTICPAGNDARVSLAIALLNDPPLLVLDEPTVGLDPVLRHELWAQFADLAASGSTLLVSSHVMDEANRCDWLILLRDGNVLAEGSPGDLLERTGTTTVEQAFLSLVADRGPS